jgi:two-component system response regulator FixJ
MDAARCLLQIVDLDPTLEQAVFEAASRRGAEVRRRPSFDAALEVDPTTLGCIIVPLPSSDSIRYWLQAARRRESAMSIVFVTDQADLVPVVEAIRCGADNVIARSSSSAVVETALQHAITASAARSMRWSERRAAREKLDRLSSGEHDVLELMLDGKVNKLVAARLGIALRTVENRRKQIFTKLGTRGFAEIVRMVQHATASDENDSNRPRLRTLAMPFDAAPRSGPTDKRRAVS